MRKLFSYLTILTIFFCCYNHPEKKDTFKVISFENAPFGLLRADGFKVITIMAKINKEAADEFKNITFTAKTSATSGTFLGSTGDTKNITEKVKENGIATVYFRLPQSAGSIIFTASVGANQQYKDDFQLELSHNYPDTLIIEPSEIKISPNKSLAITTYLRAFEEKKTSINTFINFSAFQKDDTTNLVNIGRFLNQHEAFSMADEKVNVSFLVDSTEINPNIPIQIKAEVKTDSGSIKHSTIKMDIN